MYKFNYNWAVSVICLAFSFTSCTTSSDQGLSVNEADPTLKEVMKDNFHIGVALNQRQSNNEDSVATAFIAKHFNSISPENVMKMGPIHPSQGSFNFEPADNFVAFGEKNNMFIVGHALVWHSQAPRWIFVDGNGQQVGRDSLIARMEHHIMNVAGRYKGKIDGWDVVNEALEEDGSLRKSKWLEIIGEDFIELAFKKAYEADPEAELYYNDYNLWKPTKRDGAVRVVKNLLEKGIKVDGIGMQGHYGIDYPSLEDIEASIEAFAALGVQVMVTELDIDVLPNPSKRQGADIAMRFDDVEGFNPYPESLPDSVQEKLSKRYADIFKVYHKHQDKISRVTFWGVTDKDSWLNDWPIRGRKSYPLLFDTEYQPKPAFNAVLNAVKE